MKLPFLAVISMAFMAAACTPTVKLAPPDEPIEINLNVKIDQEVRVKVDRDLETLFEEDPELFGVGQ